jgi:hypothetical protein
MAKHIAVVTCSWQVVIDTDKSPYEIQDDLRYGFLDGSAYWSFDHDPVMAKAVTEDLRRPDDVNVVVIREDSTE